MQKTATKIGAIVTSSAVIGSLLFAGVASAQTTTTAPTPGTGVHEGFGRGGAHMPGVFGTIASISGNTITVVSKGFGRGATTATPTTYTIDATNASVTKSGAASSVSALVMGDTVMVEGTVTGTNVVATAIRDGIPQGRGGMGMHGTVASSAAALIQGNGQPVVGGTVTANDGTTITITNKSNVTYSVTTSASTVVTKAGTTAAVASVVVGDEVVVQGAVSGNVVAASSVIDQGAKPTTTSGTPDTTAGGATAPKGGFVGGIVHSIGGFFRNLFGFF